MISIYVDIGHVPMFGGGHDILIADNAGQNSRSYTGFNETFSAPSPVKEKGYSVQSIFKIAKRSEKFLSVV